MQNKITNYQEFLHFKNACNSILLGIAGSQDLVDKWWESPNKAFNMLTPQDQTLEDWRKVEYYLLQFYNK